MIGLKRNTISLYDHDYNWEVEASNTISILKKILKNVTTHIEHIGSTSIKTIKAKPIIDIAIGVKSFNDLNPYLNILKENDFILRNNVIDNDMLFVKGDFINDTRTHHIHVVIYNSMEWINYINFRDYLNTFPNIAKQYEDLKIQLANKYPLDRAQYTSGKEEFITYTLRKALNFSYLGKTVDIIIDRPIGYIHKKNSYSLTYPINYGYIPNVYGGDNEELDVYLIGVDKPLNTYRGKIIAIIHRENDIEDKLVMCPINQLFSTQEIKDITNFQEKYYISHIETI